ncbi:MAG: hypothetical protein ACXWM7_01010 [Parachlamydiaceae bacterium]
MAHSTENTKHPLFNTLVRDSKRQLLANSTISPQAIQQLRRLLHFYSIKQSEHSEVKPTGIEKLNFLLKEKDKRIEQLLQYEYSAKKALQEKTYQQEALEKEQQRVKILEREQETQRLALEESRTHAQQLERAIQFLQKRVEEITSEKNQLQEQFIETQEKTNAFLLENETSRLQYQHVEKNLAEILEAKADLDQEMGALYKQFDALKRMLEVEKEKAQRESAANDEAQTLLRIVQKEKEQLKHALSLCQEDILTIKQHLTKGLRDAKELENKYSEAVTEKVMTLKSLHQLQREFEKLHRDHSELKDKLKQNHEREKGEREALEQKLNQLAHQRSVLEDKFSKQVIEKNVVADQLELLTIKNELLIHDHELLKQNIKALSKEKEAIEYQHQQVLDRLENALHTNSSLESQNSLLQSEVEAHQALCEEKQIQLEEAQQHLAKKVREAALLNEKVDQMTLQAAENDCVYKALQQANSLIQKDLEKMLEEKNALLETIQLLELDVKKEEAKWQAMDKRRQLAEEKVIALEKIEQRHAQLQSLISGFENVLGGGVKEESQGNEAKLLRVPLQFGDPLPEEEPFPQRREVEPSSKAYPNLFDMPQSTAPKSKQSLFD